ncbi:hypothetical protein [Saccharopolyspora hattusasensis]|uniref:hypothetical protein n=1 Tax=Saccharopolyspora hattusasensis TaxID=1128679 RepID=UPI003D993987
MQLPHTITLITPAEVADAYGNPVPQLDYRRGKHEAVLYGGEQWHRNSNFV